ncbi:MAG: hypothetical protein ACREVG_06995, partial [Burkholderiales bacterium]
MASNLPLRQLWRRLQEYLRPPPIATIESLQNFLQQRAALIAQKCAIDYCRGKTGLASYALFTEKPFLDALDVCRWETFVAALGDLLIVAEGQLRPHVTAAQQPRLREALAGLHAAILSSLPPPAHRTDGWGEAIPSFKVRLEAAGIAEARLARDIADHSARRLFETLPIHASMRELDEPVVHGAVRFR